MTEREIDRDRDNERDEERDQFFAQMIDTEYIETGFYHTPSDLIMRNERMCISDCKKPCCNFKVYHIILFSFPLNVHVH